ncbi:reticulon-like protein B4 [Prosopis cineraria]|uniref:reticulon-like protein B4 n=1 Tax=Prosopis cineraria TaxID=364024 RepID=UPI00240EBB8B|nr:reticulon-like protein B4 [Prosopis cineraria]
MAEHEEKSEKKVHRDTDDSNSSSEDSDAFEAADHRSSKTSGRRLFGRERPLCMVLGGGKAAEVVLWRKKDVSRRVLAAATALWFFFEVLGYHFISLACHALILVIILFFLWTKASMYIHKSAPHIPEVTIPRDCVLEVVSTVRNEINGFLEAFRNLLRDITAGKDLKKFVIVIVALWFLSVIGSSFSFLTLFYLCTVFMFTVPMLYEKNEELVDLYGEIVIAEMKKQYAVFDKKVLSQIPILAGPSKKD